MRKNYIRILTGDAVNRGNDPVRSDERVALFIAGLTPNTPQYREAAPAPLAWGPRKAAGDRSKRYQLRP